MDSRVTGGVVSYEDGTKSDQEYAPPRKVRVELRFDVAEGDDPNLVLDYASQLAANKVHELLTGKPVVAVRPPPAEASEPARRTRRTKAQIEADEAAQIGDGPQTSGDAGGGQTSADDAASIGEAGEPQAAGQTSAPGPEDSADPWEVGGEPEKEKEITDDDLNDAVTTKNAALNDPPKLRALIQDFNPDPAKKFTLREIPQPQRGSFLEKLKALA